ncbi:MAG: hypothetical protein ACQETB_08055 [Halobacteriota archaeon]
MAPDFTDRSYAALLEAGLSAGYEFITVREYLSGEPLPDRFVIVRHDVDRKPENSLRFGRIEALKDVRTTYYVRQIDKTFRPHLLSELEGLGHEIGYHYEDLDRADGDLERAHELFDRNLRRLRRVCDVETICMHGNPLTPYDNREMWTDRYSYDEYGLLGEAYLSMDFDDVTYFSDTGRTWKDGLLKVKDHTRGDGEKTVQLETTWELIDHLTARRNDRLCLLVHPNRWAASRAELLAERTKDAATNLVKYGLQAPAVLDNRIR